MSIESRFLHTLTVQHGVSGTEDAWGHAAVTFPDYAWVTVRGLVQERTGREINGPSLGGTVIADASPRYSCELSEKNTFCTIDCTCTGVEVV